MKKLLILLMLCLLAVPFYSYAQEDEPEKKEKVKKERVKKERVKREKVKNEEAAEEVIVLAEETAEESNEDDAKIKYEDPFNDAPKKSQTLRERGFEIGMSYDFSFANDFFSISKLFKETLIIDADKLSNGLKFDFGINIRPFYFMINSKKGWGFGLSTDIEGFGLIDLNGTMLSFGKSTGEESAASGAVFVSTGLDSFFTIKKMKIKLRPALYYSAAYVTTDANYYYVNTADGTHIKIDYDMYIYTILPLSDKMNPNQISGTPGLDFSVGFEYPLSKEAQINKSILDFDIGLDFINIPIISSKLKNYRRLEGVIGGGEPINILGDSGMGDFLDSLEPDKKQSDGEGLVEVKRPFRVLFHADWRPTGKQSFTIIPMVGIAHNQIYTEPFGVEAGISMRLSLIDMFVLLFGVNYIDRAWNNSFDFALNLRAFEFNIGIKMRSHDFIKSWTGYGTGVNLGFKFGL